MHPDGDRVSWNRGAGKEGEARNNVARDGALATDSGCDWPLPGGAEMEGCLWTWTSKREHRVGSRNPPAPSHTTVRAVPHTAVHE